MTTSHFIDKWLGNAEKPYNEQNRMEMLDDLYKLNFQNTMKKYILLKDLPDHPAGTELVERVDYAAYQTPGPVVTTFLKSDLQRAIETGWVREAPERIVLCRNLTNEFRTVSKATAAQFTEEEIALMEKALNGELMEKVDLREFLQTASAECNAGMSHDELLQAFNAREK